MSVGDDDVAGLGPASAAISGTFISQHRTLLLPHLEIFQNFVHLN